MSHPTSDWKRFSVCGPKLYPPVGVALEVAPRMGELVRIAEVEGLSLVKVESKVSKKLK